MNLFAFAFICYICVIYVCYICICVSGKWWWTGVWVCVSIANVSFMVLIQQYMYRPTDDLWFMKKMLYRYVSICKARCDKIKASFDIKAPWPSRDLLPHIYNFPIILVRCMLNTGTGTDAFLCYCFTRNPCMRLQQRCTSNRMYCSMNQLGIFS